MSKNKLINLIIVWSKYVRSFNVKKDPKIWVMGEWFGKRCGDNCTFFANYVAKRDSEINLYWICDNGTDTSSLDNKIRVLEKGSKEAENILNLAGAIFVNQNFYDLSNNPYNHYGKSISVNFWHGFPWKKIGHDGDKKNGAIFHIYCRIMDPVLNCKYFVSLSDIYTSKLKTAFGVNSKNIIESGYPRNSKFFNNMDLKKYREQLYDILSKEYGYSDLYNYKIVAYMPTFRDNGDKQVDLNNLFDEDFIKWLEENRIIIIQKSHFIDNERKNNISSSKNVISLNSLNASTLMGGSDVLISDYSSCLFDYLVINKPIIQFIYDYDKYKTKDRGLYFSCEEMELGYIAKDKNELQNSIINSITLKDEMCDLRLSKLKKFMTNESKDTCEKIYNFVKNKLHKWEN